MISSKSRLLPRKPLTNGEKKMILGDTIQMARAVTVGVAGMSREDAEALVQAIAETQTAELANQLADLHTEICQIRAELITIRKKLAI